MGADMGIVKLGARASGEPPEVTPGAQWSNFNGPNQQHADTTDGQKQLTPMLIIAGKSDRIQVLKEKSTLKSRKMAIVCYY